MFPIRQNPLAIDPHIDNFLVERGTKKLAIIDTEHFLTLVGFKKKVQFNGYLSWGTHLAMKCAKAIFFRSKKGRKHARLVKAETELQYE